MVALTTTALNEVEADFVEYVAQQTGRSADEVQAAFLGLKRRFRFAGDGFLRLIDDLWDLQAIVLPTGSDVERLEGEIVRWYASHALLDLHRRLAGAAKLNRPKVTRSIPGVLKKLIRMRFRSAFSLLRGRTEGAALVTDGSCPAVAQFLLDTLGRPPVIVDYGCGLGFLSFEMAQRRPDARVHLLDVEGMVLDFARHRFEKHGLHVQVVPVTPDAPYPVLPSHNLCIATEVFEHLVRPMVAYEHILDALEPDGLLHGNFRDHKADSAHVSPALADVRERLAHDFEKVAVVPYKNAVYRKR